MVASQLCVTKIAVTVIVCVNAGFICRIVTTCTTYIVCAVAVIGVGIVMSKSVNSFLSNYYSIASCAVRTCGKTGFGAGSSNSRVINYICMIVRVDRGFGLSDENRITYRAVAAFGKTGGNTSSGNSFIGYRSMACSRNNFLSGENRITY